MQPAAHCAAGFLLPSPPGPGGHMLYRGAVAAPPSPLRQNCFGGYSYVQLFQPPPLLLLRLFLWLQLFLWLRLLLRERRSRYPSLLPRPSRVGLRPLRGQLPRLCGHAGLYDPGLRQHAGLRGDGLRLLLLLQPGLNAPAAFRRRTYP